jgi:hypothetical protein
MLTAGVYGALLDREAAQVLVRNTEPFQQSRTKIGISMIDGESEL